MTRTQKILTTVLWALLVVMMVTIVAARLWSPEQSGGEGHAVAAWEFDGLESTSTVEGVLPTHFAVPQFELIDQQERTITNESLRGGAWVAAFIFTRCAGPCPVMTQKMSQLQSAVAEERVKLVSFSLDPDYDTPAVLREYAAAFEADERRWHFLTGDRRTILDVAAGMRITAMVGVESEEDIVHADHVVLIDAEGRTRGYYRGTDDAALARLADDARVLSAGR